MNDASSRDMTIIIEPSGLNVAGGARLSGLRGRVQVRARQLRHLCVSDSPGLVALDLWGCPSDMVLNLDRLPDLQEVFLPEASEFLPAKSGQGVDVHVAPAGAWRALRIYGRVARLGVEIFECESLESARGNYWPGEPAGAGEADGVALLDSTALEREDNIQRYVRIDQHERGLQYKDLRRGVRAEEVLWKLVRPVQQETHPAAWFGARSRDPQALVAEPYVDTDVNSEATLRHSLWHCPAELDESDRIEAVAKGLEALVRLAHRGLDATALWRARCCLLQVPCDRESDPGRATEHWPWLDWAGRGDHPAAVFVRDMELHLLCRLSHAGEIDEACLPAIYRASQAAELACLLDRLPQKHDTEEAQDPVQPEERTEAPWHAALVRCLTRALERVYRRFQDPQGAEGQLPALSREERRERSWGRTLGRIFAAGVHIHDRDCTRALTALVRDHLHGKSALAIGIDLAEAGNPAGRTMIVRALNSGERISPRARARVTEALLAPTGSMERQDVSTSSGQ